MLATTISHKSYAKAVALAEQAVAEIPLSHNRVRTKTYFETMSKYIASKTREQDIDVVGRRCLWSHTENLGNRRYADYVRRVDVSTIKRVGKSSYQLACMSGWTPNVIVLYR